MSEPFRAREMRPGDGEAVVALWQRFLPDDEAWADWLPQMLDALLAARLVQGGIVMAGRGTQRCAAAGISCFVPAQTAEAFVAAPRPYLNKRLLTQYRDGDHSVFLGQQEQARGNMADGLDLVVLEYCQECFDFEKPWAHQVLNAIVPVYVSVHAGFNIRRSFHETEKSVGHIQVAGGNPHLFDVSPQHPFSLSAKGHGPRAVYGVSRANLSAQEATGIARAILFSPRPSLRLVPQEQQVILHALDGLTDAEIARELGLSRDRVRQIWQGIYAHIEDVVPDVFAAIPLPEDGKRRGGEKRRVTVAFLRNKPEELRPYCLRRRATAKGG